MKLHTIMNEVRDTTMRQVIYILYYTLQHCQTRSKYILNFDFILNIVITLYSYLLL